MQLLTRLHLTRLHRGGAIALSIATVSALGTVSTLGTVGTVGALGILEAIAPRSASAIERMDGTVQFIRPPSLGTVWANRTTTYSYGATYYFTLEVPSDAGEPLQRVTVAQRDGAANVHRVSFDAEASAAFLGTRRDRGPALTVTEAAYDRDTQTVSLALDPPVAPGNTVTIALRAERNPRTEGVYLFGVTAFPGGAQADGQFLGYGRLHFYGGGDRFDLF
ncbi:MAG TPA: DUF2808 domain-containing protein [Chroococcidiopsis sp.]